jgi:hypothetical protein
VLLGLPIKIAILGVWIGGIWRISVRAGMVIPLVHTLWLSRGGTSSSERAGEHACEKREQKFDHESIVSPTDDIEETE